MCRKKEDANDMQRPVLREFNVNYWRGHLTVFSARASRSGPETIGFYSTNVANIGDSNLTTSITKAALCYEIRTMQLKVWKELFAPSVFAISMPACCWPLLKVPATGLIDPKKLPIRIT